MASETPEDDKTRVVDDSTDDGGGGLADATEDDTIAYEEISFTDQPGFKPMIGIVSIVFVSFILLAGLPMYAEPGDGELTLFSYTAVIWGVVIIACGFIYEYWLMKIEGGVW